jgi:hypothetical protein
VIASFGTSSSRAVPTLLFPTRPPIALWMPIPRSPTTPPSSSPLGGLHGTSSSSSAHSPIVSTAPNVRNAASPTLSHALPSATHPSTGALHASPSRGTGADGFAHACCVDIAG